MRKWELLKQNKLLKINNTILSTLFNEKHELKLREFTIQLGLKGLFFFLLSESTVPTKPYSIANWKFNKVSVKPF